MKKNKIILDTNLWISFLITKRLSLLDKLIEDDKIQLIFLNELLEEFIEVASRTMFRKYFNKKDIENILEILNCYGEMIIVNSDCRICRDDKDNFLLNLAIDSNAHYLITGDKDLLILEDIGQTKILTFKEFIKKSGI